MKNQNSFSSTHIRRPMFRQLLARRARRATAFIEFWREGTRRARGEISLQRVRRSDPSDLSRDGRPVPSAIPPPEGYAATQPPSKAASYHARAENSSAKTCPARRDKRALCAGTCGGVCVGKTQIPQFGMRSKHLRLKMAQCENRFAAYSPWVKTSCKTRSATRKLSLSKSADITMQVPGQLTNPASHVREVLA